jgi:phosphatidyl-myo-inositol alpha-mannosyltransferase
LLNTSLRVALVCPYDFAFPGGVGEHIRHLARHLRVRGHTVEIIAPFSTDDEPGEEGFIKLGSGVHPVPFAGSIARITLSPSVWREVKEFLESRPYDIVHVHEPKAPFLSPAVLHYSRSINVGTFHHYRESLPGAGFSRAVLNLFIERLHGRIAVSSAACAFVEKYFPAEYRIIPNGIEVAEFQGEGTQPWERWTSDGKLNILFMGRLEKRKGFRHLLRAFRTVKQALPKARLFVAGAYDRADRLSYVRYVRHFRIRDVKFIGYFPAGHKARWYRTAHVFCAPSTGHESFGMVLAEAMAAGTPIVASDIPGYRDVVRDGVTGDLVPPGDEAALADALLALLDDPERRVRMSAAALQEVQRYDWANITGEIEAYYWELLARHRCREL